MKMKNNFLRCNFFLNFFLKNNFKKIKNNFSFRKNNFFIFLFFIFYFFSSCIFSGKKNVSTAFYFWRTRFNLNASEKKTLTDLNVSHLYIKILDIDGNDDDKFPTIVSELDSLPDSNNERKITPVIFITNRTFTLIPENLIDSFADALTKKCFSNIAFPTVKEIQFDCDWTETTRSKYFSFLKRTKHQIEKSENKNIQLSATIRLYQYKYFEKTGVPPVNNGTLMVYNLNALDAPETQNAILDVPTLQTYLTSNKNYPIPLNIALPLYSQGVILRDGNAAHLFNNLIPEEVKHDTHFLKKSATTYSANQNCYFKGVYVYADDVLRIDTVSIENLEKSAELLSKKFSGSVNEITFFSLDSVCLKRYNPEELKTIVKIF